MRKKPPSFGRRSGSVYAESDSLNFCFSPEFFLDPCVKPCHGAALGGKLVDVLHQGCAFSCVGELGNACLAEGVNKIRYLPVPKEIRKFKYLQLVLNAARPGSVGFVCSVREGEGNVLVFGKPVAVFLTAVSVGLFDLPALLQPCSAFVIPSVPRRVQFSSFPRKMCFLFSWWCTSVFYFRVCFPLCVTHINSYRRYYQAILHTYIRQRIRVYLVYICPCCGGSHPEFFPVPPHQYR